MVRSVYANALRARKAACAFFTQQIKASANDCGNSFCERVSKLNCSKCGAEIGSDAAYCQACGKSQGEHFAALHEDVDEVRESEPRAEIAPPRFAYAGFWLRLAAYLLDSLLLGFAAGIVVFMPLMSRGAISPDNLWDVYTANTPQFAALRLLMLMIQWAYFAVLESSPWQASLGTKMFGLKVTDLEGRRISFGRATGRFFCTLLSGFILLIGFFMIAFTQKKQALHDILTGCLVIKSL